MTVASFVTNQLTRNLHFSLGLLLRYLNAAISRRYCVVGLLDFTSDENLFEITTCFLDIQVKSNNVTYDVQCSLLMFVCFHGLV
jgi:hypothetical protein